MTINTEPPKFSSQADFEEYMIMRIKLSSQDCSENEKKEDISLPQAFDEVVCLADKDKSGFIESNEWDSVIKARQVVSAFGINLKNGCAMVEALAPVIQNNYFYP